MSDFRIAQLTDLHLTTKRDWLSPVEGAKGPVDFLQRAYQHWFESPNTFRHLFHPSGYDAEAAQCVLHAVLNDTFDSVLITGDLATTGEDADLQVAVEYLHGKAPEWWHGGGAIPALLGNLPVMPMPGNHERYSGTFSVPGSGQFERQLGLYWDLEQEIAYSHKLPHEESGRVRIGTFGRDNKRLGIVMADMSLRSANQAQGGKFAYYGQGEIVAQVAAEMVEATLAVYQEAKEDGLHAGVLWAVHFPPEFPGIEPDLRLLNGIDLIQAAAAANVALIVCGHTHKSGEYTLQYQAQADVPGHGVRVICSGPTCGLGVHDRYSYTALDINIPGPQQVACTPTHFQWMDRKFVAQPEYPKLS